MPLAVGAAFVLPHHTDRLEPDALVAANRPFVSQRGVDRQPMVTALAEQVTSQDPYRRHCWELLPVIVCHAQREVDAR